VTVRLRWLRIAVSVLAGGVVTVAPYLLLWRLDWGPLDTGPAGAQFALLVVPLLAGGLVVTLCARSRPNWLYGAGLGLVLGLFGAVLSSLYDHDSPGFGGMLVFAVALETFYGVLVGSAGGMLGSLVCRPLLRERPDGKPKRIKPWHVGAALALAELVLVGVTAAVRL
jgi:hypothetical protein